MAPPCPDELTERAIARWLAHGITSRTHPVLRFALQQFHAPLGVEAEALEAEPFSALEAEFGGCWLHRPKWKHERFARDHPAFPDFRPLIERPTCFAVSIDSGGLASIDLLPLGLEDPACKAYWESSERGWSAARHTLQAAHAAESFIHAAAGLLLANDPLAAVFAEGDDEAFCRAVVLRRI